MKGQLFLRTGVVLLLGGMLLGMHMGMAHDFTDAPVHAHLNLVGGVLMAVAGLFYNARPDIGARAVGVHYVTHLLGALLLPAGIYGSIAGTAWAGPVVGVGSVLTVLATVLFAINVFRRVPVAAPGEAPGVARIP